MKQSPFTVPQGTFGSPVQPSRTELPNFAWAGWLVFAFVATFLVWYASTLVVRISEPSYVITESVSGRTVHPDVKIGYFFRQPFSHVYIFPAATQMVKEHANVRDINMEVGNVEAAITYNLTPKIYWKADDPQRCEDFVKGTFQYAARQATANVSLRSGLTKLEKDLPPAIMKELQSRNLQDMGITIQSVSVYGIAVGL